MTADELMEQLVRLNRPGATVQVRLDDTEADVVNVEGGFSFLTIVASERKTWPGEEGLLGDNEQKEAR